MSFIKTKILGLCLLGAAIGIVFANKYYMREAMYAEDLVIPDDFICVKNKWGEQLYVCSNEEPFSLWFITPRTGRLAATGES